MITSALPICRNCGHPLIQCDPALGLPDDEWLCGTEIGASLCRPRITLGPHKAPLFPFIIKAGNSPVTVTQSHDGRIYIPGFKDGLRNDLICLSPAQYAVGVLTNNLEGNHWISYDGGFEMLSIERALDAFERMVQSAGAATLFSSATYRATNGRFSITHRQSEHSQPFNRKGYRLSLNEFHAPPCSLRIKPTQL